METDEVYIRPGVVVEESWNSYVNELLTVPKFFYIFILQVIVLVVAVWTMFSNYFILEIAERKGHPPLEVILVLVIPLVLLPAFISYTSFKKNENYLYVWYSLILFDLFFIIWIVSTLFEGIDQGIGIVMAFVFLLAVVWYTIVNQTMDSKSTNGCIVLCIITLYLIYYSYQIL